MDVSSFMLLDLHTHILPELDDGAKNSEEAGKMLDALAVQRAVAVLTPHFYPYEGSISTFLQKRKAALERLCAVRKETVPLVLGSEVLLVAPLLENESLERLCIGRSNYILVELPFTPQFEQRTWRMLEELRYTWGLRPILAHVERYTAFHRQKWLLIELRGEGYLLQVNASAFLGAPWKCKFAYDLLKKDQIDFLGSDCHSMAERCPNLDRAIETICDKKLGQALDKIWENSTELWEDAYTKILV